MQETCKTCEHCKPTYKGGACELKGKRVKYCFYSEVSQKSDVWKPA